MYFRKPHNTAPSPAQGPSALSADFPPEIIVKESTRIPLPNELENEREVPARGRRSGLFPVDFLSSLTSRIRLEDIILLGLILLLLYEGIQDDLLLVVLLYIFLT